MFSFLWILWLFWFRFWNQEETCYLKTSDDRWMRSLNLFDFIEIFNINLLNLLDSNFKSRKSCSKLRISFVFNSRHLSLLFSSFLFVLSDNNLCCLSFFSLYFNILLCFFDLNLCCLKLWLIFFKSSL